MPATRAWVDLWSTSFLYRQSCSFAKRSSNTGVNRGFNWVIWVLNPSSVGTGRFGWNGNSITNPSSSSSSSSSPPASFLTGSGSVDCRGVAEYPGLATGGPPWLVIRSINPGAAGSGISLLLLPRGQVGRDDGPGDNLVPLPMDAMPPAMAAIAPPALKLGDLEGFPRLSFRRCDDVLVFLCNPAWF